MEWIETTNHEHFEYIWNGYTVRYSALAEAWLYYYPESSFPDGYFEHEDLDAALERARTHCEKHYENTHLNSPLAQT